MSLERPWLCAQSPTSELGCAPGTGGCGGGEVRAEKFCSALPASQPWLLVPKHFTCLNVKLNLKKPERKISNEASAMPRLVKCVLLK